MDRRSFLKLTGLAAGLAAIEPVAVATQAAARPSQKKSKDNAASQTQVVPKGPERLKLGVLSDVHIYKQPELDRFEQTLRFFKQEGVDGVILAGDIADDGLDFQMEMAMGAWDRVFAGTGVEKLMVYGNHDVRKITERTRKRFKDVEIDYEKQSIRANREQMWEKYVGGEWAPIWVKQVKGYTFIGGNYVNSLNMPGLEKVLSGLDLKGDKPFFYIQHTHPKGTCSAPWTWGQDDGKVTRILSKYPNCVALSGHSHTPLVDDRTVWQGEFTSIGTASLKYLIPFGYRENTYDHHEKSRARVPAQMKVLKCKDGHHGMIMTVYDNALKLDKYEFLNGETLGKPWIVPIPANPKNPFTFDSRAQQAVAPQFPKDAKITVSKPFHGVDRYKTEVEQIRVSFPYAISTESTPRAFDFEVQVETRELDHIKIFSTKRVHSAQYYLGEKADNKQPVEILYGVHELPSYRYYRYAVRPMESFGKAGEPIYSEWIKPDTF